MSLPNYQFCYESCDGRLRRCPHYQGRYLGLCDHYKLVHKGERRRTERVELSRLEDLIEVSKRL